MDAGNRRVRAKVCLHCSKPATRPRSLCWEHYEDRAVRELYPAVNCQDAGRMGGRPPYAAPIPAGVLGRIVPRHPTRGIAATARRLGRDEGVVRRAWRKWRAGRGA